jgi:5-methylcytosine-specific restriction protein A
MYSVALRHFREFITDKIQKEMIIYPDEISSSQLTEGNKKQITVNAYERNPYARQKCIEHFGAKCLICGFDFAKVYGDNFSGIIHVHHLKPISKISQEYIINPIEDLVPVCPNCHLVIHSKPGSVYTIEEVKQLILQPKR